MIARSQQVSCGVVTGGIKAYLDLHHYCSYNSFGRGGGGSLVENIVHCEDSSVGTSGDLVNNSVG
jgi:hypothetical protein